MKDIYSLLDTLRAKTPSILLEMSGRERDLSRRFQEDGGDLCSQGTS